MSEISERYARLADAFADKVAAVPPERWDSPSPCPDWTARDVVRHVVTSQTGFRRLVGRETEELPSVEDDPVAAWAAARYAVQRDLEDPQLATTEYDGLNGRSTFEAAVDTYLCTDLVVHGWDLARATGLDDRMDPGEIARVQEMAHAMGPALRSPGAFGPKLEAPEGADAQDRLLAFLGRRP